MPLFCCEKSIFRINQTVPTFSVERIFVSDFLKLNQLDEISSFLGFSNTTPWYPTQSQVTQCTTYQPQNHFGRIPRKTCLHLSARSLQIFQVCVSGFLDFSEIAYDAIILPTALEEQLLQKKSTCRSRSHGTDVPESNTNIPTASRAPRGKH